MEITNRLGSYSDIKNMSIAELYDLCEDLRAFLLTNVSKTGGHLASNLGVVEITVAIHNVFNTINDRLIFDVGHQCYPHKILTGRADKFKNLRNYNGVSGFPDPDESEHDAFISGHASTSVSVALGMARARTAMKKDYSVIALIGDGALTGGLAYEGLSDAGHSEEPLIVILNDNEMSIAENVGGLAMHLSRLRVRRYYLSFKKIYRKTIAKIPFFGKKIDRSLRKMKTGIKEALLPLSMFENMGFVYLGPADGHNIKEVCKLLKTARDMSKPTLIHLVTTKGKGYKFAEENPEIYHGVPCFDIKNGEPSEAPAKSFGTALGEELINLAKKDERICAITAAMQSGTGLDEFAEIFSDRFFDVGIAEGHAVTMAAGLAKQGMKPVCAIYATFIQRAYDMLFHDISLTNQHVVFAVDRAGFVADDGKTHQGVFDVGIFLQMPNFKVLCPSSVSEIKHILHYALYDCNGPVVIRYPRGGCECYATKKASYEPALLREGKDAVLISYGRLIENTMQAAKLLDKQGINVSVIKLIEISDVSVGLLSKLIGEINTIFVIEECVSNGSVASKLALDFSSANLNKQIIPLNLGKAIIPPATVEELMKMFSLDAEGIAKNVLQNPLVNGAD
ncbi:MAG: 1-deoxy-D-xylulose-5-phosphate synthase [Oscillospiraceae bacterium]|jgi:1-deoxy-D-xylulose-5-phosphate synthase|nr:1-deoxy-D-xylulose-5-phosphate synthase [Oscillospiraceae bacterium]